MFIYKQAGSLAELPERFWSKVNKTDECWTWTAARDRDGYGIFRFPSGNAMAHRVAYELSIGQIPSGLCIDHLCRNRGCVNPAHLEAVTASENNRRSPFTQESINIMKTHCIHGHEFAGRNLVTVGTKRRCRECINESQRQYQRRKRGEAA